LREQTAEGFLKTPNNLPIYTCKKGYLEATELGFVFFQASFPQSDNFKLLQIGNLIKKIITHSFKNTKIFQNLFPDGRDYRPLLKCVFTNSFKSGKKSYLNQISFKLSTG